MRVALLRDFHCESTRSATQHTSKRPRMPVRASFGSGKNRYKGNEPGYGTARLDDSGVIAGPQTGIDPTNVPVPVTGAGGERPDLE